MGCLYKKGCSHLASYTSPQCSLKQGHHEPPRAILGFLYSTTMQCIERAVTQ